jgi:hypothetical protein
LHVRRSLRYTFDRDKQLVCGPFVKTLQIPTCFELVRSLFQRLPCNSDGHDFNSDGHDFGIRPATTFASRFPSTMSDVEFMTFFEIDAPQARRMIDLVTAQHVTAAASSEQFHLVRDYRKAGLVSPARPLRDRALGLRRAEDGIVFQRRHLTLDTLKRGRPLCLELREPAPWASIMSRWK